MVAVVPDSQVLVGSRIRVLLDGAGSDVVGYAQGARCMDDYGLEPVQVLDQLEVLEYVPTHARHQINMNFLVLRTKSLQKANLAPVAGGRWSALDRNTDGSLNSAVVETGKGTPGALRALHSKTYAIEILDSLAANAPALVKYTRCYFNSQNVEVGANRIMATDATWYAVSREGLLSVT